MIWVLQLVYVSKCSFCMQFVLMVGADGREFPLRTGSYISASNKLDWMQAVEWFS